MLVFKFRPDKEHKQYFKTARPTAFMRVGHPAVAPLAAMFEAATAGELHRKCEYKPQFWSDEVLGVAAPWVRPLRSPVSEYVHHAARYLHNQSYDLAKLEKELLSQASSTDKWFSKDDVERVMGPLLERRGPPTTGQTCSRASSPPPAAPSTLRSRPRATLPQTSSLRPSSRTRKQRRRSGIGRFCAPGKPGGPFTERAAAWTLVRRLLEGLHWRRGPLNLTKVMRLRDWSGCGRPRKSVRPFRVHVSRGMFSCECVLSTVAPR